MRCIFADGELQEEISKTKKKREDIDEKARAIRDALAELMPFVSIQRPAEGASRFEGLGKS